MSHFVQKGENGYREVVCCADCKFCDHYQSQEWTETHCDFHDGKMIEYGPMGICDKHIPRDEDEVVE